MALLLLFAARLHPQYLKRAPRRKRPTAHLSYDEGLHLVKAFLVYASHHTVEEFQAFTSQWIPAPSWIRLELVTVSDEHLAQAAAVLETQLGPEGLRLVGGKKWWKWRKPKSPLQAEWIEMKSNIAERKKNDKGKPARRVMFYVHGGAYFMGSVDEHRYQMQRHARKLKARVFAPRYRLAPQFPFPCGMYDCLAAYLHLLSLQDNDASTIVVAGDSAGGGMVLSLLVIMRDRGIPMPAGAVLVSPWVDLTHSFPSLAFDAPFDYIPAHGFHQRTSMSWPPPSAAVLDEMHRLSKKAREESDAAKKTSNHGPGSSAPPASLSTAEESADEDARLDMFAANNLRLVADDGSDEILVNDQIQIYTTNNLVDHPLVSPALQPTLGGLPPLLITVGGGEILRDEQIFVAHKAANPQKYAAPAASLNEAARAQIERYPPTNVQLQVWDDLCHVPTMLSFTRPAKFMFRSIAQFGAWALARAQKTEIDILDDDNISVISVSSSDLEAPPDGAFPHPPAPPTESAAPAATNGHVNGQSNKGKAKESGPAAHIGKAGDPLPPFKNHMIRQRVTRHGDIYPLAPPSELPGTRMILEHPHHVGIPKEATLNKWIAAHDRWETKYAHDHAKIRKKRLADAAAGFVSFGPGEHPPPSALAGRIKIGQDWTQERPRRTRRQAKRPLVLWTNWGSKHDASAVEREQDAEAQDVREAQKKATAASAAEPAASADDARGRDQLAVVALRAHDRSRSRRRIVRDEHQADVQHEPACVPAMSSSEKTAATNGDLNPYDAARAAGAANLVGSTGKRPFLSGIAVPFSLNREAETASMKTLHSTAEVSEKMPVESPVGAPAEAPVEAFVETPVAVLAEAPLDTTP